MTIRIMTAGLAALLLQALPATAVANECETDSPWGGSLEFDYTSNFYEPGSYNEMRTAGLNGILDYRFENGSKASINLAGTHSFDNPKGQYWKDGWLKYGNSDLFTLTDSITLGLDGSLRLPMSEQSRKDDLHTSLRVATPLSIDLANLLDGLEFTWQPRLMKNFHEYQTRGGRSLKEWTLENLLSLDYTGWERWSFNASLVFNSHRTYQGARQKDDYIHAESVYYDLTDNWSIGLMYSNAGIVYDLERGGTGSIELFDKRNATWSALISYSF
ncbi:hypothetical protein ACL00X_16240 [Aeromonas diversa]|uniref:hypothetical protein n=1 Tax=Aeromonas diversa TaxID=502790 RepID=UPI0039A0F58A